MGGPIGSETIYNEGGTNGQTLNFILSTDNDGLFSGLPAVDPATGHLTYKPAPGSKGMANITVILQDDGETETPTGPVADPKQDPAPGATAKKFTIIVEPFPEVVSVIPAPDANNVPTGIYLELGFSQSMDTGSVLASRLTITDVTGEDDVPSAHDANY